MKSLVILFVGFLFIANNAPVESKVFCETESDCEVGECCHKVFWMKLCVEKGSWVGARCGGKFKCESCLAPFKCVPFKRNLKAYFRLGAGKCYLYEPDVNSTEFELARRPEV